MDERGAALAPLGAGEGRSEVRGAPGRRMGLDDLAPAQHRGGSARGVGRAADGGRDEGRDRRGFSRHPVLVAPAGEPVEGGDRGVEASSVGRLLARPQAGEAPDRGGDRLDLVGGGERAGGGAGACAGAERPAVRQVEQVAVQAAGRAGRPLGHRTEEAVEVVAMQVRSVAVARATGGAGRHERQRRRLLEGSGGDMGRGVGERIRVVERGRQPAVDREPAHEGPVAGEAGMALGVGGAAVRHQPPGGALVHLRDELGVSPAQRRPQQVGEQGVVAVPPVIGRVGEEHARPLEVLQPLARLVVGGQQRRQVGGEALGHAGAEQEVLDGRVLAIEHLLEQVVRQRGFRGRCADDQLVGVASGGQGAGRQPQPGRPPLCPRPQRAHVVAAQIDALAGEELRRLVERELEVGVADLAEPPVEPHAPEGDRRVGPRAEHEGQAGRDVLEEEAERPECGRGAQVVDVVEHEHPRARRQRVDGHVDQGGVGAPAAGRVGHGPDAGQCLHHATGEAAGLVVPLVEGDPGGGAVVGAEPRRDEGGLAGAGEPGHEGHRAAVVVAEPGLEPVAADEPVGRAGDCGRAAGDGDDG